MRRDFTQIKKEAERRGISGVNRNELLYLGILFALEDLAEKVRK